MSSRHGGVDRARRRWWLLGVVVVAAAYATLRMVGLVPVPRGTAPGTGATEALPVFGRLPAFTLTEREGRPVTEAALRGSVWVSTFFFSRCQDTCPLQVAQLSALAREFREAAGLRLVAITVDPTHDTPAALRDYAARLRINDPRVWLLTGDRAGIAGLARQGFHLAVAEVQSAGPSGAVLVAHSDRLALVDRESQVRGTYQSQDAEALLRLRRDLSTLLGPRPGDEARGDRAARIKLAGGRGARP